MKIALPLTNSNVVQILTFADNKELEAHLLTNPTLRDFGRLTWQTEAPGQEVHVIVSYPSVADKRQSEADSHEEAVRNRLEYMRAFNSYKKKKRAKDLEASTAALKQAEEAAKVRAKEEAATEAVKAEQKKLTDAEAQLEKARSEWKFWNSPAGRAKIRSIRTWDRRRNEGYNEEGWEMLTEAEQDNFEIIMDKRYGAISSEPDPDWNPDKGKENATISQSDVI